MTFDVILSSAFWAGASVGFVACSLALFVVKPEDRKWVGAAILLLALFGACTHQAIAATPAPRATPATEAYAIGSRIVRVPPTGPNAANRYRGVHRPGGLRRITVIVPIQPSGRGR